MIDRRHRHRIAVRRIQGCGKRRARALRTRRRRKLKCARTLHYANLRS